MLELARFPAATQARVLSSFLYELTMGVRAIHTTAKTNMLRQLYGINQINRMVMPFIHSILYGHKRTYTIEVIMQNLVDKAPHYDIKGQVAIAWDSALSYALRDQEGGDQNPGVLAGDLRRS